MILYLSEGVLRAWIIGNLVYHTFFWFVLYSFMVYDILKGKNGVSKAYSLLFVSLGLSAIRSIVELVYVVGYAGYALQVTLLSLAMLFVLIIYLRMYLKRISEKLND